MVEITELNREPASTVSTLTATTEVTSPSVDATDVTSDTVSATTEVTSPSVIADALEANDKITAKESGQNPSNNGEIRQNNGTVSVYSNGQVVEIKPIAIKLDKVDNYTKSDANSISMTISQTFDEILINAKITDKSSTFGPINCRINGDSGSEYNYTPYDGTQVNNDYSYVGVYRLLSDEQVEGVIKLDGTWLKRPGIIGGLSEGGDDTMVNNGHHNGNGITSPLDSVTLFRDGDSDLADWDVDIYGRDLP